MFLYLKQNFYNPTCIKCGSLFVNDSLFCSYCENVFLKPASKIKTRITENNNKHIYLIDWIPNESDVISQMAYKLKKNQSSYAWRFFANELARQMIEKKEFDNYLAIVPLPGSAKSSTHSKIFAESLSQLTHIPVWDCLKYELSGEQQKAKTKKQRLEDKRTPILRSEFVQFTDQESRLGSILFVDDILTTGQTFKSSLQTFNLTESATILTLFYRQNQTQS